MNAAVAEPKIRPVMIDLIGLDGARLAKLTMIVNGHAYPEVVMFNGDPFIPLLTSDGRPRNMIEDPLRYRQVRPFRADLGF